jgi:hypothetical protein
MIVAGPFVPLSIRFVRAALPSAAASVAAEYAILLPACGQSSGAAPTSSPTAIRNSYSRNASTKATTLFRAGEKDRCRADLMLASGQKRKNHRGLKSTVVRYYPNSGQTRVRQDCPLCANRRHRTLGLK